MGKAMFKVDCPELGFSRSVEIVIDARGWARKLADDLNDAIEVYQLRVELDTLKRKPPESAGPRG